MMSPNPYDPVHNSPHAAGKIAYAAVNARDAATLSQVLAGGYTADLPFLLYISVTKALEYNDPSCFDVLLAAPHMNVNANVQGGNTVLHLLIMLAETAPRADVDAVIQYMATSLVRQGANPFQANDEGMQVVEMADTVGQLVLARAMNARGAQLNAARKLRDAWAGTAPDAHPSPQPDTGRQRDKIMALTRRNRKSPRK